MLLLSLSAVVVFVYCCCLCMLLLSLHVVVVFVCCCCVCMLLLCLFVVVGKFRVFRDCLGVVYGLFSVCLGFV